MGNVNTVILEGNLTRDPELSATSGGRELCKFRIASNHYQRKEDGSFNKFTDFFDVNVWNGAARRLSESLSKGSRVVVTGQLRQNRWEDKEGNNRSRVTITAREVETLPRGGVNNGPPAEEAQEAKAEEVAIPF